MVKLLIKGQFNTLAYVKQIKVHLHVRFKTAFSDKNVLADSRKRVGI
jgi:hypothetical protein